MKVALISGFSLAAISAAAYVGYFFISPSVTVTNSSSDKVSSIIVTLPSSRLDFGGIEPGGKNTIYYSITQADGKYVTSVTTANGENLEKSCGFVKNNEFHKRVKITFTNKKDLTCEGT